MDLMGDLLSIQLSQVQGLPKDGPGDVNLIFFMTGTINIQALCKKLLKIKGKEKRCNFLKTKTFINLFFLSEFSCKNTNIKLA